MTANKLLTAVALAALGAGIFGVSKTVIAQSTSTNWMKDPGDTLTELGAGEGIFVDGKTFRIVKGKAKGDPAVRFAELTKMGAKEVGPGTLVFRYADKLYMLEAAPQLTPQAMKEFQDQWAVGYMKAQKEFQDQWAVGYMKSFQDQWAVGYMKYPDGKDPGGLDGYQKAMKEFQDHWNVSYMKAAKEFQDQWNVSYVKSFQDQWNVGHMNAVKSFQDTFSMMK